MDSLVLFAAVAAYWLSIGPCLLEAIREMDIVLFSKRVAYTQEKANGDVYITNLLMTPTKRIFVFLFVNLIEIGLLLYLSYVGVSFL